MHWQLAINMNLVRGRQMQKQSYATAVGAPELKVKGPTGIWAIR